MVLLGEVHLICGQSTAEGIVFLWLNLVLSPATCPFFAVACAVMTQSLGLVLFPAPQAGIQLPSADAIWNDDLSEL